VNTCETCGRSYAAPRGGRFCRPACRTAAWHLGRERATTERDAAMASLVLRQTRAIIDGAPAAELDAILAEAIALVGDDR